MAKQNRKTLKNFFGKGKLPTESQFGDLIDSSLNLFDDCFEHTPENGFHISTSDGNERLFSFFSSDNPQQPLWNISLEKHRDSLVFQKNAESGLAENTLCLVQGRVGIGKEQPETELDVSGVLSAAGRRGTYRVGLAPADGKWHSITGDLYGCQAFEVIAGVGKIKTGKYALLHAIALNTHHPCGFFFNFLNLKRRIKCTHAYYRSIRDKIKLRWQTGKDTHHYQLQIRSGRDYGAEIGIQYSLTKLWFDEDMSESILREKQQAQGDELTRS
ncbi:hypothetical protein [Candidatus Electronema sp. PJ]|uniref:hypothetical protein n=1 Tax=Candidatus Electronema sp. PJ TaxID=3401572 RepID=UPI003AA7D0F6